jgi:hypothetical protein
MNVDLYCERTAPGLWNEPANAVSNVAFLAASTILIWLLLGQRRRVPVSVWVLPVLVAVVGLCSLTFHMVATSATLTLDNLGILVFILSAVTIITHWVWPVAWRWVWLAAPAYMGFAFLVNLGLTRIGGERAQLGGYVPALLGLFVFALLIRFTGPVDAAPIAGWLLTATGVFAVSLLLRTVDQPLCADFPVGTHWIWHIFNAVVLFLVSYTVVRRWQRVTAGSAVPAI